MPIMEISVVPLGTSTSSVSEYVASCIEVLKKEKGIRFELTAMGTIVEAESVRTLFRIAEKMHKEVFHKGIKRVVTSIKIDDRTDKPLHMKSKVESVIKKQRLALRLGSTSLTTGRSGQTASD